MTSELEKEPSSFGIYLRFWWHRILAMVLVGIVLFAMLMMSPDAVCSKGRSWMSAALERRYAAMQVRAQASSLGTMDRLLLSFTWKLAGRFGEKEPAAILEHLLAGKDSTLEIPARHLRHSDAVGKALGNPAPRVTVKVDPADEPRFSFGLAGATIEVKQAGTTREYDLRKRIEIDPNGDAESVIVVGRLAVRFPDALVHTAGGNCCKPFDVHAHWADTDPEEP